MAERIRIGDMLVAAGFVTDAQVEEAVRAQRKSGLRLGEELVELGFVSEVQLTQILSNQLSIPWVSLYHVEFSRELLSMIPREIADSYGLVPVYERSVRREGQTLFIAMDDPTNEQALAQVALAAEMPVKPMVAPPSEIRSALRVYYYDGELPPSEVARNARIAEFRAKAEAEREEPELIVEASAVPSAPPPEAEAAPESPPAPAPAKKKRAQKPNFITLTLLDGTSIRLPAPGSETVDEPEEEEAPHSLTANDLVSALLAKAEGKDVSNILPDDHWEPLFATLLTLLLRKGLIADWEFVEEWKKKRG